MAHEGHGKERWTGTAVWGRLLILKGGTGPGINWENVCNTMCKMASVSAGWTWSRTPMGRCVNMRLYCRDKEPRIPRRPLQLIEGPQSWPWRTRSASRISHPQCRSWQCRKQEQDARPQSTGCQQSRTVRKEHKDRCIGFPFDSLMYTQILYESGAVNVTAQQCLVENDQRRQLSKPQNENFLRPSCLRLKPQWSTAGKGASPTTIKRRQ